MDTYGFMEAAMFTYLMTMKKFNEFFENINVPFARIEYLSTLSDKKGHCECLKSFPNVFLYYFVSDGEVKHHEYKNILRNM